MQVKAEESTALERLGSISIDHLSASSVNKFIENPALWYIEYVRKVKSSGPAAWRGSAVEKAIIGHLLDPENTVEEAANTAVALYEEERGRKQNQMPESEEEKADTYVATIPDLVAAGCSEIRDLGQPTAIQKRVEGDIGVGVPLVGYLDLEYEDRVIDVKVVGQMPSSIETVKNGMLRQMAFYRHATGKPVYLLFIAKPPKNKSHTGFKLIEVPEELLREGLHQLQTGARALLQNICLGDSIEDMARFTVPNFDSYMWDEILRKEAAEVWAA